MPPAGLIRLSLPLLLVLAAPGAAALTTQADPKIQRLQATEKELKAYHALVRRYRANDREPSIRALASFSEAQLRRVVENVARLKNDLVSGEPVSTRWDVEDVRAAVLLQTERAIVYARLSSAGLAFPSHLAHLETARRLLECVDPTREGWADFRRSWWRSVIPWIHRRIDRPGLRRYALDAVAFYPDDPEVRLAVGTAFETSLQTGWGEDPDIPSDPLAARREFEKRRAGRAGTEDARLALENLTLVLKLVPDHSEARLRRGRAHQLVGDEKNAAEDFRALLAMKAPQKILHLAHLFLGAGHEQASPPRLEEAQREYEAALQGVPTAQSARLALGSVLLQAGDRSGAEGQVQNLLTAQGEVTVGALLDPWSAYGLGQSADALATFSRLRTELWRGWPR